MISVFVFGVSVCLNGLIVIWGFLDFVYYGVKEIVVFGLIVLIYVLLYVSVWFFYDYCYLVGLCDK